MQTKTLSLFLLQALPEMDFPETPFFILCWTRVVFKVIALGEPKKVVIVGCEPAMLLLWTGATKDASHSNSCHSQTRETWNWLNFIDCGSRAGLTQCRAMRPDVPWKKNPLKVQYRKKHRQKKRKLRLNNYQICKKLKSKTLGFPWPHDRSS